MKKNYYLITLILLLILTVFLAICLYKEKYKPAPVNPSYIDTVYVNRPFKSIKEYNFISMPYLVTFWADPEIKIDTVYVDNIKVHYIIPSGHVEFNHQILVKYPESPKLIQMITSKNTLELTLLKPDGFIRTEKYNFYPEINYYNYQSSGLTYERKPFFQRFEISPEIMIRPIVNMYDINLGLKYKTRKIYYEIGLNSYYYPSFELHNFGFTPYLRIGITL